MEEGYVVKYYSAPLYLEKDLNQWKESYELKILFVGECKEKILAVILLNKFNWRKI